jgi:hypothetical protein
MQLHNDAPPILYKFRSDFTRDLPFLLGERKLFLASPPKLNDLFDCYPAISLPPANELNALIAAEIEAAPAEARDELRWRCDLLVRSDIHRQRFVEEFYRKDLSQLGVLSLSARNDSLLEWSHYAGGASGFAVGYRGISEGDREAVPAFPVTYSGERARLFPLGDSDWVEILSTKSDDWAYEREWRYVRTAPDGGHGNMDVPTGAIVEVCLGPRTSTAHRDAVLATVRDLEDQPRVLQAVQSRDHFGLEFREC